MEQEYEEKLKQWIDYDNKLSLLKEEICKLNESKKSLEDEVLRYVEQNDMVGVSVNTSDGTLKFSNRKVQQSITMKYIRSMLHNYNVQLIEQEDKKVDVEGICKFLVSNLETKQKTYIKRDYREG